MITIQPHASRIGRLASSGSTSHFTNNSTAVQLAMSSGPSELLALRTVSPFAWSLKLDWDSLAKAMGSSSEVAKIRKVDLSRLNAMFYTQQEAPLTVATATDSLILRHLLSSIVNGINQDRMYQQLTAFPKHAVIAVFQSLSEETILVICQRLRTAAITDDDPETVEALLELEHRLCKGAQRADTDLSYMLNRLKTCERSIAITLVRYVSRASNNLDLVLQQVLGLVESLYNDRVSRYYHRNRLVFSDLMRVVSEAGATLTQSCFFVKGLTTLDLQGLLDLGGGRHSPLDQG